MNNSDAKLDEWKARQRDEAARVILARIAAERHAAAMRCVAAHSRSTNQS